MLIVGIDPGVTGGIAFLHSDGKINAIDIPVVNGEVNIDALMRVFTSVKPDIAIIERASSRPGQGVSSTFKFGVAYGALRALVVACGIPHSLVSPVVWKRHFKLSADKEEARALAIRLWPGTGLFDRRKDHGRSEAALIAKYEQEVAAGKVAA